MTNEKQTQEMNGRAIYSGTSEEVKQERRSLASQKKSRHSFPGRGTFLFPKYRSFEDLENMNADELSRYIIDTTLTGCAVVSAGYLFCGFACNALENLIK